MILSVTRDMEKSAPWFGLFERRSDLMQLMLLAVALLFVSVACGSDESAAQPGDASSGVSEEQIEVSPRDSQESIGEFQVTGLMGDRRQEFGIALLHDGRVLFVGGRETGFLKSAHSAELKTAELYDPETEEIQMIADMSDEKKMFVTETLSDGRVLVAGGISQSTNPVSTAEIYDPTTNAWTPTGDMHQVRDNMAWATLQDGRVLVAGGNDERYRMVTGAEAYDLQTGQWTEVASMEVPRSEHTATTLQDGRVLMVGGGRTDGPFLDSAEIYDPATDSWTSAGTLTAGRSRHTVTLLLDGRVLVVGGRGSKARSSAEIYDPKTNTWSSAGVTNDRRGEHIAGLLPDGRVLVAGGTGARKTAEIYDPETNSWSPTDDMEYGRYRHKAVVLDDGRVLIVAGIGKEGVVRDTEVYVPSEAGVVNRTRADRSQSGLDANEQEIELDATPTPLPTSTPAPLATPTPTPERREVVSESVEFSFPEAIESDPTGTTATPLGQPVRLAIGQTVVSPGRETGMQGEFVQVKSDDRDSGGTAVVQIELRKAAFLLGTTDLVLEATGGAVAKKVSKFWVGLVDLEYDSDNNPIAIVVIFTP